MTNAKINLLILPLLVSIVLSTVSKLKMGNSLNAVFYTLTAPIHIPVSTLRLFTSNKIQYFLSLPQAERQGRDLKSQNARLITENEFLKQKITDQKTLDTLQTNYKEVLPVRPSSSTGKFTVSSSQLSNKIRIGQPLVSGNVLLGFISEIKGLSYTISPLDTERVESFSIRSSSGPKGIFKYLNDTPQITDVPSQTPLVLGDFIISEPSDLLPGNLLVGKITRLISTSQEPLQKAEITLYDSLSSNPENLVVILQP